MGKGQSEVIKALLLIGIMVAAMISYIEITSNFTTSYEEELVTRSFRSLADYIIQTVYQNSAAMIYSPESGENIEYVVVNLDLPKRVGNHYYTVKAMGDRLKIYANDNHDLSIEYPKDGIKGFSISGEMTSASENFYLSIGNKEKKASVFSSKILYSGEVSPELGSTDTTFRYSVIYQNARNEAPDNVYVYINDDPEDDTLMVQHSMTKATDETVFPEYLRNNDFRDGEIYYLDIKLGNIRDYSYYFVCVYNTNKTDKFPVDRISGPNIPIIIDLSSDKEIIEAGTGDQANLLLTVKDKDNNPVENVRVTFTTDIGHFSNGKNEHTVYTDTNGEATETFESYTSGIAHIEASVRGTTKDLDITVHSSLDHIIIEFYDGTPVGDISLRVGERTTFYARGYDKDDHPVGDIEVEWSYDGTLDLGDPPSEKTTSWTFTPESEGEGKVYATYNSSIFDDTGTITVYSNIYEIRIVDDPNSDESVGDITMTTADTLTLYAKGYDAQGNFVGYVKCDWSISSGNLDSLSPPTNNTTSVTFEPETAHTSGVIKASKGSYQKFTGTITVEHNPNVVGLGIFNKSGSKLDSLTIKKDKTYDLYAKGIDSSETPLEDVYVTWSCTIGSLDPIEGSHSTYSSGSSTGSGTITIKCYYGATEHYTEEIPVNVQSSCPFFYSYDNGWHYEHESYPFAIAKSLEYTSYELLDYSSKIFKLTEERDEISYTNQIYLIEVDENVYPDIYGNLHRINEKILPSSAYSDGKNVLDKIIKKDHNYWIQGSDPDFSDSLTLEFNTTKRGKAKLFLTIREGERSVYILKCIHEYMGTNNMGRFYKFVEDNPLFRPLFKQTVRREFFIHIDVWDGEKWIRQGEFGVGREGFIDVVIPIEIYTEDPKIRLSTGSGAYEIDYAFIDSTDEGSIDYRILYPSSATLGGKDVISLILKDDDRYLRMITGDSLKLTFETREGYRYIVAVKGYYHPFFGDTYVSEKDFLLRIIDFLRGITEKGYVGRKFEG